MIEILIIVAIMALISVVLMGAFTRQMSRARDAQRKDHLEEMRVAFEDYYNDNQCYPPPESLAACGSDALSPYLKTIPCDPQDEQPYVYFSLRGDMCRGYRVLVRLENLNDPNIESMGCDATNGCYWDDPAYNFGIAMGDALIDPDWEPEVTPSPTPTPTAGPTPTPSPTPTPPPSCPNGAWVISPSGTCSCYTNAYLPTASCPATYASYAQCFAASGCTGNCTEDDVPLYLRCER